MKAFIHFSISEILFHSFWFVFLFVLHFSSFILSSSLLFILLVFIEVLAFIIGGCWLLVCCCCCKMCFEREKEEWINEKKDEKRKSQSDVNLYGASVNPMRGWQGQAGASRGSPAWQLKDRECILSGSKSK